MLELIYHRHERRQHHKLNLCTQKLTCNEMLLPPSLPTNAQDIFFPIQLMPFAMDGTWNLSQKGAICYYTKMNVAKDEVNQ